MAAKCGHSKLRYIIIRLAIGVAVIFAAAALGMYVAVFEYPEYSVKIDEQQLKKPLGDKERMEALDRARRIGVGAVAALGGLALIIVNWRRAKAMEDQVRVASEGQINERRPDQ